MIFTAVPRSERPDLPVIRNTNSAKTRAGRGVRENTAKALHHFLSRACGRSALD
jgi:hypothetical protein